MLHQKRRYGKKSLPTFHYWLSTSTYIEVPLGRVELADYLCADRSALTRELSNMKRDGLLDYDKNTFHLLK